MNALELFLLLLAGGAMGWINVLAGGGSLLTLPTLLFMGFDGPLANGTNRLGIFTQNLAATTTFIRRGFRRFGLAASLTLCGLPGVFFGTWFGLRLHGIWFERVLALVMLAIFLLMLRDTLFPKKSKTGTSQNETEHLAHTPLQTWRLVLGHICMIGVGAWCGFIHIGIGFLYVPVLHHVMQLDLVEPNKLKVFSALIFTVIAMLFYATSGQINWAAGAALALGGALGGWLGAHMTLTRGAGLIKTVFLIVILALILKLLLF